MVETEPPAEVFMNWLTGKAWKAWLTGGMAAVSLSALLIAACTRADQDSAVESARPSQEPPSAMQPVPVRVIRARCDPSFALSVKAPAQVQTYEAADLESQVAGRVEYIRKAEGSRVQAGELLVKIAVPDLAADVLQKESVIRQREAELALAEANQRTAQTAVAVAGKSVEVAKSAVQTAQATEDYRLKEYRRFVSMARDNASTGQLVDEQELAYKAAAADTMRARANVLKVTSDLEEAQAKFDAAKTDVKLKAALVEVARKDRDHAQVLADYAKILAPFDGVITHRSVDPGSFVQNATSAHTQPLLRIERQDLVTVTMKVPDTFAPCVGPNTEAVIEMSELPGQLIHGKVTRFSPSLESAARDHTLPVQVDLFNGTEGDYQRFLANERAKKQPFDDLKEGPLPIRPEVTGAGVDQSHQLYPGMYGEMKLIFRKLANTYLLPSDAIVRQGGSSFLYLLRNGKAALVPVEVQVDDQRLAKVVVLEKTAGGLVKRDLTGQEEVIYSNQSELSDGQAVKPMPQDWSPQD
jgi:multidrug efflux pump subunit AcrA (membrane-fusion protein)